MQQDFIQLDITKNTSKIILATFSRPQHEYSGFNTIIISAYTKKVVGLYDKVSFEFESCQSERFY